MIRNAFSYCCILAVAAVVLTWGKVANAGQEVGPDAGGIVASGVKDSDDGRVDIDDALEAVREGRALPLSTLESIVKSRFQGDVVNVEIERKKGILFYEFKILRPLGRITEVEINAASGKVQEVENE